MKTIIINVIVVTMNRNKDIFWYGFVLFDDSKICSVGTMDELNSAVPHYQRVCQVIDGKNGILMPGMVNTHTHMGMIPFRGLGDDCKDRLRRFLFPMEQKAMDKDMVYHSTAFAAGEMLLGGTTTVFDMYYFEAEAARAMDEMGIRGIAAETVMDKDSCDCATPNDALSYAEKFMKHYADHPRIKACAAPHGTSTCSREILIKAHQLNHSYRMPFSLHTAEMDYEMDYFRDTFDMTPVEYLNSIGVLDENTLAAHCIHMTEHDLELLLKTGASVAHCIGSNTKAAKGIAPVSQMMEKGICVGLGTDGPASGNTLDLFTQMKMFANFHKTAGKDRCAFPAASIVEMATLGGAQALHLEHITGSIEIGKQADFVLVETDSPNMFPVYDPYSALVYSAQASNVSQVFVAGECLVRDKILVKYDMETLKHALYEKIMSSEFKKEFIY